MVRPRFASAGWQGGDTIRESNLPPTDEAKYTQTYPAFWRDPPPGVMGPWNPADPSASPAHVRQEEALAAVLARHRIVSTLEAGGSIFEAGCGKGRLTSWFRRHFPAATYEAIDISPFNIVDAAKVNPDGVFSVADLTTYDSAARYDDPDFDGFDLVVASEVLMHVPPSRLEAAFSALIQLVNADRGRLITIDWVPTSLELTKFRRRRNGIAYWNFPHAYERIFRTCASVLSATRTDSQVIYVIRP